MQKIQNYFLDKNIYVVSTCNKSIISLMNVSEKMIIIFCFVQKGCGLPGF